MKGSEKKIENLEKILQKAHFNSENISIEDGWQTDAMRQIRNIGPLNAEISAMLLFNQFIWRFAGAACVLLLVLSVYVLQENLHQPEYEMANLFMSDPLGFSLLSFGIL